MHQGGTPGGMPRPSTSSCIIRSRANSWTCSSTLCRSAALMAAASCDALSFSACKPRSTAVTSTPLPHSWFCARTCNG